MSKTRTTMKLLYLFLLFLIIYFIFRLYQVGFSDYNNLFFLEKLIPVIIFCFLIFHKKIMTYFDK